MSKSKLIKPARAPKPTVAELCRYWYSTIPLEEAAVKLGISVSRLKELRREYKLLPHRTPKIENLEKLPTDPSPEEIAERAKAVREKWAPHEFEKRLIGKRAVAWKPPIYSYDSQSGFLSPTGGYDNEQL